jgi:hypothetical protein
MVAPMVAASDPSIKGLVFLSAGGGKMYESALRQSNISHQLKEIHRP